jgi:hypothetical protein
VSSVGTGPTVSLERPGHPLAPGGVSPQHRVRQGHDRNYLVLTVDQCRIIKMRACRDRAEARAMAGLNPDS